MKKTEKTLRIDVPCPFCALLCDDLVIENQSGDLSVVKNACQKAIGGFSRPIQIGSPKINGEKKSFEMAVSMAASILKKAKQPLLTGLGTDVSGMRSVMELADKIGGVVDHMYGQQIAKNSRVLQDTGLINTTLAEIRNRADLIILAGTDTAIFPRFIERIVNNKQSLFHKNLRNREIVYLGDIATTKKLRSATHHKITNISCKTDQLGEIFTTISMLMKGFSPNSKAGVSINALKKLLEQMKNAVYGVVVWCADDIKQPHIDITIQTIYDVIRDMNHSTRFAGFPLVGNEGSMTANNVCAWQSGYPLSVSYARGYPEHDTLRFSADEILTRKEADAMLWISSISSGHQPPTTDIPVICLTEPNTHLNKLPTVHIPVGTVGVEHRGQLVRCDGVVSQALSKLRSSSLPSVSFTIDAILQAI